MAVVAENAVDAVEGAAVEVEEGADSMVAEASALQSVLLPPPPPRRPVWAEAEAAGVARI